MTDSVIKIDRLLSLLNYMSETTPTCPQATWILCNMYLDTYQDNIVTTKQKRYERTPKGRQARQQAIATYRNKRVKWEVWLDAEMSEALEASIPNGISRSDYLRKIFQKHLDKVCYMIHTEIVEETNKLRSFQMTNEELLATELQNKVRAFSGGKIEYFVLKSNSFLDFAQDGTYSLSEEGLKGFHLINASVDRIEEFCQKDTEERIAKNPEWFNRI